MVCLHSWSRSSVSLVYWLLVYITHLHRKIKMKACLAAASVVFLSVIGVALAGACPETCEQPVVRGCHGITLKVPASVKDDCGCHGRAASRVTHAERREVRSMARQNYRATMSAGRDAARNGDGVAAVEMNSPSLEISGSCNGTCK